MVRIEAANAIIELHNGFSYSLVGAYVDWQASPTTTSVEVLFVDNVTKQSYQGSFISERSSPTEKWANEYLNTLDWSKFGTLK